MDLFRLYQLKPLNYHPDIFSLPLTRQIDVATTCKFAAVFLLFLRDLRYIFRSAPYLVIEVDNEASH